MQSVSGNVVLRKVNARRIEAGSVSGDGSDPGRSVPSASRRHSVSGNVEFSGTLAKGGRYELNSHSGDVRLTIGPGTGFELEASSFSGSIRSDLPLKGDRDSDSGPGRRRSLNGVFGDGSAVLDVTTFSGNIVDFQTLTGPSPRESRRRPSTSARGTWHVARTDSQPDCRISQRRSNARRTRRLRWRLKTAAF